MNVALHFEQVAGSAGVEIGCGGVEVVVPRYIAIDFTPVDLDCLGEDLLACLAATV